MSDTSKDEYQAAVVVLSRKLLAVVNAEGASASIVLDALLSCYVSAAMNSGRLLECAGHMVQQGGQFLLQDAMEKQAAGLKPFAEPTRH
jgi:hypothetical protein